MLKSILELKIRLEEQSKVVDETKIRNVELDELLKAAQQEKNSLQTKLQTLESLYAKFFKKYQLLEAEIVRVCQFASTFESTVQRVETNQAQLLKTNEKLYNELKYKTESEDSVRKQGELAIRDLSEMKGKFTSLELDLQSKHLEIQKFQGIILEKDGDIQRVSAENALLHSRLKAAEENNREMDLKMISLNNKVISAERRRSEMLLRRHDDIRILTEEKIELEKRITLLAVESTQKTEEASNQVANHRKELQELSECNQYLEQQLQQLQVKLNESTNFLSLNREKSSELEQKIRVYELEIQSLKLEKTNLLEIKEDEQKELEVLQLQNSKNEILIKKLEQDVFRLQLALDESKREAKNKSVEATFIETATHVPSKRQEALQEKRIESSVANASVATPAPATMNTVIKCKSCSKPCFGLVVKCSKCSDSFHALCTQTSQLKNFVCSSCRKSK